MPSVATSPARIASIGALGGLRIQFGRRLCVGGVSVPGLAPDCCEVGVCERQDFEVRGKKPRRVEGESGWQQFVSSE